MHSGFLASLLVLCSQEDPERIQTLIRGLISDRAEIRLDAEKWLVELGDPAVPALIRAGRTNQRDLVSQANKVVRRITGRKSAVGEALLWLVRHQQEDGSWEDPHGDFRRGVTGLVILAFLKEGYTRESKTALGGIPSGKVLARALDYLVRDQDPEGCLINRKAQKYVLTHAVATTALLTAPSAVKSPAMKERAKKAVDFLLAAQNPGKGWRYAPRCIDNDSHVTSWAVLALRAAEKAGVRVPESAYDGPRTFLKEVRGEKGRPGYTHRGTGKIFIPSHLPHTVHPSTLTAMGLLCWTLLEEDEFAKTARDIVVNDPPKWDKRGTDFYYWFFGALSLRTFERVSGPSWKDWNREMINVLLDHRGSDGSWTAPKYSIEMYEGTVYATAMATLALEIGLDHHPDILDLRKQK